jgi:hypothetical protein
MLGEHNGQRQGAGRQRLVTSQETGQLEESVTRLEDGDVLED